MATLHPGCRMCIVSRVTNNLKFGHNVGTSVEVGAVAPVFRMSVQSTLVTAQAAKARL